MKNVKLSHLWKAWVSTLIGIAIGFLTSLSTVMATGEFDQKAFWALIVPVVTLGLTDFLKEVKKYFIDEEAEEKIIENTEK